MSHGGGGGGFGHGGGVSHGGGHHGVHGGGHPDQLPSWNSAMQGGKRSGRFANFSPKPIFFALGVFSVMLVPFVLDWDNPVLQRMLIGHDLTAKDIAHQNAVNQAVAGTMRSQASRFLGSEAADALVPEPVTGRSLIAEPAPQGIQTMGDVSEASPNQNASAGGTPIGSFSLSAGNGAGGGQQMPAQAAPVTGAYLGTNQRFISQPMAQPVAQGSFSGQPAPGYFQNSSTEYQGPRHKVIVDR
jgi:hypothetical protein